jgi:Sec-independent protein translocase protein TatA
VKWLLILVLVAIVVVIAVRKLKGSGRSLRDADPRKLRDEFRRNSGD